LAIRRPVSRAPHDPKDHGRTNYDGCEITLRQSKTGVYLTMPTTSALRRMLDGMERRGQRILPRPDGRPWHSRGDDKALSKAFRAHARADASRTKSLGSHDLRGTAVVLMCGAGFEIPQVAAISGHTLRSASDSP
jgi:hypothetical protein